MLLEMSYLDIIIKCEIRNYRIKLQILSVHEEYLYNMESVYIFSGHDDKEWIIYGKGMKCKCNA